MKVLSPAPWPQQELRIRILLPDTTKMLCVNPNLAS